ncbi:Phosphoglycerate kinase [bioreactor metagenome]|uniref:phosphoglycerate kinase n=1 Tax=bioreactor metagenome TaxID=1076179 RepID=A0A644UAQ4_9ZZZZ|nr:phosphoglycerate kinase [Candidatus Elulimicrobiales bacterium]
MKKIILRLDLNVPIEKNGNIRDTERIDAVIPEIKKLSEKNKIIILSHLGKGEKKDSLKPVENYLRKKLNKKENENIQILDNVRFWKGETLKKSSKEFKETAKYFASLGDEYINDAFATMHREHASIVGIPEIFKKENKKVSLGDLSKIEIKNLEKSLKLAKDKKNKTLLILSGAKISTKLPLITKFLDLNAKVFVGGGMANQILKDVLNLETGSSFLEKDFKISPVIKKTLLTSIKNKQLLLPIDVILKNKKVETVDKLKEKDYIADIGPTTLAILKKEVENSKNIILNGPLGLYEDGFDAGTIAILKILKNKNVNILIGGGDTLVLVKNLKIVSKNKTFISTAGGAMLEYLAKDGKLPGLLALN